MRIGIDVGGMGVKAGLVDDNCHILYSDRIPTGAQRPGNEIVRDIAELAKKVVMDSGHKLEEIEAVGIGCPGTADDKNGVLVYSCNINFKDTPMRAEFQKVWNVPVHIGNDANCAAWGEFNYLNDDSIDDFIAITLGTGVGGGIIINKQLYTGFNGAAAEIGHFQVAQNGVPCTCGRSGCWERYASVTGLIRITKEKMEQCPDSSLHDEAKKEGKVSGRTAFLAAKAGDKAGQKVVDEYINNIAEGLISVINIFQPNVIAIGGAISKEGDYLLNPLKELVLGSTYARRIPQTKLTIAKLGNDAGIIGAALLGK